MYNPINKTLCDLPDLPVHLFAHNSAGGVICGEQPEKSTCLDISSGSWSSTKYQETRSKRYFQVWNINPGENFMLLGGQQNQRTTDIVHNNGNVEPGFNLEYDAA